MQRKYDTHNIYQVHHSLRDHPEVVRAGEVHEEKEPDEVIVVVISNAIVDPRTMVVCEFVSRGLQWVTPFANPF